MQKAERVLGWIDGALGVAVTLLVAGLVAMWWGSANAPHGGVYALIAAVAIAPLGLFLLLPAFAMRRGWRIRWWLQALPLAYPAAVLLLL